MVQFPLYEWLRKSLNEAVHGNKGTEPASVILIASTVSKMIAGAATYPHEVLRTRLHTHVHPTPAQIAAEAATAVATSIPEVRFDSLSIYGIAPRYELEIGLPHPQPFSPELSQRSPSHKLPPEPAPPKPTPLPIRSIPPLHIEQQPTLRSLFTQIVKAEGWRGLYKGFGTNLVKTVPATAATMMTFEMVKRRLEKIRLGETVV